MSTKHGQSRLKMYRRAFHLHNSDHDTYEQKLPLIHSGYLLQVPQDHAHNKHITEGQYY